jgi:transposase InsO family protein
MLLHIAKIPRSTYYYHLQHLSDPQKHVRERVEIRQICEEHKGRYGYRRVTLVLRQEGYPTNHKLVMKLMREEHLSCLLRPKKYRSHRGEIGKVAPNRLNRHFKAVKPNSKWTTDITEFKVQGQKLYLSPILDLYNSEIVSHSLSKTPNFSLVMTMLRQAFRNRPEHGPLMLHSDQGWHYQMKLYQRTLKENGITQSMSRKGNCYDNCVIENFFGLLKTEFFHNQTFKSVEHFQEELANYIDYYNNKRIKVKLKGLSPVQFRTQSFVPT